MSGLDGTIEADGDSFAELLQIALSVTADALSITNLGKMINERYLHHYMSHRMQVKHEVLELQKSENRLLLHPEWPTWKKSTGLKYGQYKCRKAEAKKTKKYFPANQVKGGAGFIDFALGSYNFPVIAIEVTTKSGWGHEEVVYDLMKLLDARNRTFKAVISCNVILRELGVAKGGHKVHLNNRMNEAFAEAKKRLGNYLCKDSRMIYFFTSEISPTDSRHWHYDCKKEVVVENLQGELAGIFAEK
ncbi:hypothetical protein [Gimesia maris]|uniref:hypothetical protein n=1 Tax=Gimesia maris TaxID=122 RepID=UPI003A8FAAE3